MADLKNGFTEFVCKLKKDKKSLITVIIGLTGMLLVLLSELPAFSSEKTDTADITTDYSQDFEKEVENLISEIEGAGKVKVMLTYDASQETIWAKDSEFSVEPDGSTDNSEKHILIDAEQGETGLCVKVIYPKVRGAAVVCDGGNNPEVVSRIKSILSALFDIGSNNISIAQRGEEE